MDTIKVVCGIILKDDRIFLCRRNSNKQLGGYWEFPGGKVELNETQKESLQRELQEELGMKVNVGQHYKTVVHQYETFVIELTAFKCQFEEATYTFTDHDQYEWVTWNELMNYKLAPADMPIAEQLIADFKSTF